MARDPTLFPEPDEFKPERWLEEKALNYNAFQMPAFSAGPRICLGRDLAILETKLTIAETLLRYKFTTREIPEIPYRVGIPLTFNGDLNIFFEKRESIE